MEEKAPLKAFVIGPIGDKDAPLGSELRRIHDDAFEILDTVIKPACEANALHVTRADEIIRPGDLVDQVLRLVRDSHVVVADLTGANANVMYELGLRHSTGRLTIQIGEKGRLPFDVSTIRTIMFTRTPAGLLEAKRRLLASLGHALTDGADPVAATRIWIEEARPSLNSSLVAVGALDFAPSTMAEDVGVNVAQELAQPVDVLVEDDKPGFLDNLAELEEWFPSLTASLNTTVTIMDEIAGNFTESTARLRALTAGPRYAADKLKVANILSIRLASLGLKLKVTAGDVRKSVDRMDAGMTFMLAHLPGSGLSHDETARFVKTISSLAAGAQVAHNGATEIGGLFTDIGNAARTIRVGSRDAIEGLKIVAGATLRIANWAQLIPQDECSLAEVAAPLTIVDEGEKSQES
jgi:hypothetical protein